MLPRVRLVDVDSSRLRELPNNQYAVEFSSWHTNIVANARKPISYFSKRQQRGKTNQTTGNAAEYETS